MTTNFEIIILFYYLVSEFVSAILPFSRKSDQMKEKQVVSFTYKQNTICSQTQLDDIAHE